MHLDISGCIDFGRLALFWLVHSRNADGIEVHNFLINVCKTSQSICLPLLACLCSPLLACLCLPLLACFCLFACLCFFFLFLIGLLLLTLCCAWRCIGLALVVPWLAFACIGLAFACLGLLCLCLYLALLWLCFRNIFVCFPCVCVLYALISTRLSICVTYRRVALRAAPPPSYKKASF